MRRVNVHFDEQLDDDLAATAARGGESKASLIRRAARAYLDGNAGPPGTGWEGFTGAVTDAHPDDRPADEVIYG